MAPTRKEKAIHLKKISALLLLSAETEEEELFGVILALKSRAAASYPQITRGPYNAVHSDDFLENIMHRVTDRRFKAFFRCVYFMHGQSDLF